MYGSMVDIQSLTAEIRRGKKKKKKKKPQDENIYGFPYYTTVGLKVKIKAFPYSIPSVGWSEVSRV